MKTILTVLAYFLAVCFISNVSGFFRETPPICEGPNNVYPSVNCSQYYQCSNAVPILQDCPPGLFFNPLKNECDFPVNVRECVGGTRPPPNNNSTTTISPPDNSTKLTTFPPEYSTTTEKNTTEPPVNSTTFRTTYSPPDNSTTTKLPPYSTVRTTEDYATYSSAPNSTYRPSTDWNGNWTTSRPGICPPVGVISIPYPGNCSLYYLCVEGQEILMSCAEGLLFDPILGKCNKEEEVECYIPTTEAPIRTTAGPGVECPSQGVVFIPDPTDCSKYFICVNGDPIPEQCAEGLLFDPDLLKCNTASEVECNNLPKCPQEDGVSYLPIPNTCSEYIMCISGTSFRQECANGTLFSPIENKCVLEDSYDCPYSIIELLKLLEILGSIN